MKINIKDDHLEIIQNIICKYHYTFCIFGSRAKNNNNYNLADIDICIIENIDDIVLLQIQEEFTDSNLPYKVDLVSWHKCSKEFQSLIYNDLACIQINVNLLQDNLWKNIKYHHHVLEIYQSNKDNTNFTISNYEGLSNFLEKQIDIEYSKHKSIKCFGYAISNSQKEIIAGSNCYIVYGSVYISQLWVHKSYRKTGIASKILNIIEHYARNNSCQILTICTMSFQNAKNLYQKIGFSIEFERIGYDNNASMIFLSKKLN